MPSVSARLLKLERSHLKRTMTVNALSQYLVNQEDLCTDHQIGELREKDV